MATQAERLKKITDDIQSTYESLRRAAANISGLLQAGRATCDEVKAYNLWAVAIWNTQRGMLASLRAGGEPNVPPDPPQPTLFVFRGVPGEQAINISCAGEESSLSGLMKRAMRGPAVTTRFFGYNDVQISTSDPFVNNPEAAPSYKALIEMQQRRPQEKALGAVQAVFIIIALATVVVSIAIVAIMQYLEVNAVQEANTEQTKLQADAFANYTSARLECLKGCTAQGKSTEDCVDICRDLVDKPNIKIPGLDEPWGMLQWVGFTVVLGFGLIVGWKIYQRKSAGKPLFQLPESVEHAINPP